MKFIKTYKNFLVENIDTIKDIINSTNTENCKWDISQTGVKVFFDITPYDDPSQTPYGKLLILSNTMKDLVSRFKNDYWEDTLVASTHVGFIFSDGRILHATSEFNSDKPNGVQYEDVNGEHAKDIMENPKFYVVFNLGGDEKEIEKIGDSIIKFLIDKGTYGKSYDWTGIKRIFPDLKKVLVPNNEFEFKQGDGDNNNHKETYYCSLFVAYVLVQAGIITMKQLGNLKIENTELNPDENVFDVNPTELYELISKVGKISDLIKNN